MKSTRTKKRQGVGSNDLDLWDDLLSAMSGAFAQHQQTAASTRSATKRMASTNSMANAAQAPTTLTVTISTTILSTTFITVPVPQSTGLDGNQPPILTPARPTTFKNVSSLASHSSPPTWSSTTAASGATGTSLLALTSPTATRGFQTASLSSGTTSAVARATAAASSATSPIIGASAAHSEQKKAIVGGLSASIAGLLLIGVAICLFLRRRRRRRTESKDFGDWSSEKGTHPPPTLVRKWTGGLVAAVGRGSPKQTPERPMSMATVSVDEDHRIIRMNTKHWMRPYAPGAGEGYRESAPPGELRVVNPDPSRPASPARLLSDSPSSFVKKQRAGLTGFVFGTSRPLSGQRQHPLSISQMPPTITVVEPALSRECIATYERTPSFRSYPSVSSVPIVQSYPVDDPFLTPPEEEGCRLGGHNAAASTINGLKRPSLATLQGAKGSASRTISHLGGHLLHPFRSKSSTPAVQRTRPYSTSTELSLSSRRSDPFDLDAASVMHPSPNPNGGWKYGPNANANWTLYEGT